MPVHDAVADGRAVRISTVTVDPASVATIVAAEQNVALQGLEVGDAIVAFPAAALTAGITVRASIVGTADQFSFRCVNPTAGAVDAASAVWAIANLRGLPQQNVTINPASVATIVAAMQNITIPGLRVGDCLLAIPPVGMTAGVDFIAARVVTADTLPLLGVNPTIGAVDAASGTWRLVNLAPLRPHLFTIDPGSAATITAGNIDVTVPGIRTGDCIIAIPPQTLTAGVFPVALRAPSDNTLRLRVCNPTAGAVDAASAVWALVNLGS